MSDRKDSTATSGWKAELEPLPPADELEFLRWFYRHADSSVKSRLVTEFMEREQKGIPESLLQP